ncbi:MAG: hypothetical protein NTV89_09735 [Proteobacteria bacterium]|nr:hypothetical protein [Pseudomonadota bacterium]
MLYLIYMPDYSITFKNKTFAHEKVELDGKQFENCDFRDCLVILEKGETRLTSCRVDHCQLLLKGNAYTIGQILALFAQDRPLKVAEFDETGSFFPEAQKP